MKYLAFTINDYRAIVGPLEVNIEKSKLIPIIGINECGKTTILNAIFAFDHFNDNLNDGRHLRDALNLYSLNPPSPVITATISLTAAELVDAIKEVAIKDPSTAANRYLRQRRRFPTELKVHRDVQTKKYSIEHTGFDNPDFNDLLGREIVRGLPYTLFFDDFRDSVDERMEIPATPDAPRSTWLAIMEQLFQQTDPSFSVFKLRTMEERRRKTLLAKVTRHLNRTLTDEWQNFRLDESDALQIAVQFEEETTEVTLPAPSGPPPKPGVVVVKPLPTKVTKHYLKLEVIETDLNGDEHYFFIRDRSKGFFWFFNFVMKLEFNPKIAGSDSATNSIFLLDEPGSYLHASAQTKLCKKLRQLAQQNCVAYCTHSHYLLDPEVIPISSIRVADKTGDGRVTLASIHDHPGNILERRSAFQPVVDALLIKPFLFDLSHQRMLITEGIYDFYAFEMFKGQRNFGVLPSVGCESIKFYVSLMIAWRISYVALWDNDVEGLKHLKNAVELFGEEEAKGKFFTLPGAGRRILQDLFDGQDVLLVREKLSLPARASFEKMLVTWFYSLDRHEILRNVSEKTKKNFEEVFNHLQLPG